MQTFELAVRAGARLLPGGDARSAARRRCCSTSTRSGSCAARAASGFALGQYVNDRPYVASSFLSVAIARGVRHRAGGQSKERPELARRSRCRSRPTLPAVPCRGGEALLRRLFEPLGYAVDGDAHAARRAFPEWGESRVLHASRCAATLRLRDLLAHLYVLVPVLDDDKHYWVGDDEVEKLLRHGEGWLRRASGARADRAALPQARSARLDDAGAGAARRGSRRRRGRGARRARRRRVEERVSLQRAAARHACRPCCRRSGARRVLDLGCGEGELLRACCARPAHRDRRRGRLAPRARARRASGCSSTACRTAQRERIALLHGSLDLPRRAPARASTPRRWSRSSSTSTRRGWRAFERVLFGTRGPALVVVTTPNAEYNVRFETLPAGHAPPPRPPLRVDARRVRAPGRRASPTAHGYAVALPAGRAGGRRGRAADADGGVRAR